MKNSNSRAKSTQLQSQTSNIFSETRTNSNTINIGAESELTGPLGTTYKAVVNRSGDKLTTTANGADVVIEIVGGQLVETMSAKGQTFKRISSK